ncbi:MAG: MotA/TolQ/ExbB proton channel family protein [Planctomycetota bacterium]|nr:MotA/TolQ/ExbB proton channel family protein [Planctomycetota bacterium]
MNAMGSCVDRIIACIVLLVVAPHVVGQETTSSGEKDPPGEASTATATSAPAATGEEVAGEPSKAASDGDLAPNDASAGVGDGAEKSGDADEPSSSGFFDSGVIGLLREGGLFMWPILLMGVLAMGVILERYRSLKMVSADSVAIRGRVQQLLQEDRVEEALKLCATEQGPVAAVLSSGLRKYYVLRRLDYDSSRIDEQVVKAMDDYSVHIVAALERHLSVLATVSSAAPMLGFLGTVQGMIVAFQDIVAKMGETNIVAAAASGIQVSLLTTCFGLIVGIPAFIAFNYFTSVINRFVLDVEESATELIESVTLQMAVSNQHSDQSVTQ